MNLSAVTFFDKNIEQLSMNIRIEAAKFEPEPTFENTINYIKAKHLKSIISIDMIVSSVTSEKTPFSSEHLESDLIP